MNNIHVLLVGTGRMAETHADRFAAIDGVAVLAAVDVNLERCQAFCLKHSIAHAYDDLSHALSEKSFDAVAVVTPDAWHEPVVITALDAGLAVLCEKPLSDSVESARRMADAANRTELLNTVNLSYRNSGALQQARALIDDGMLGDIRHVEASYRQSWLCTDYWGDWKTDDAWLWRLSQSHGSLGVLGDVGIHILDFMTAGVGLDIQGLQCRLQTFPKAPDDQLGDYKLDANDSAVVNVEFANGALGVVHMSRYYTGYRNDLSLSIHGTLGAVTVSTGQSGDRLETCIGDDMHHQLWTDVSCHPQADTFERFVSSLTSGTHCSPDFNHAARLQLYLELCFSSHENGVWLPVN